MAREKMIQTEYNYTSCLFKTQKALQGNEEEEKVFLLI
jgi:hypothetical protein